MGEPLVAEAATQRGRCSNVSWRRPRQIDTDQASSAIVHRAHHRESTCKLDLKHGYPGGKDNPDQHCNFEAKVKVGGSGPPLLYLHTAGGPLWDPFVEALC